MFLITIFLGLKLRILLTVVFSVLLNVPVDGGTHNSGFAISLAHAKSGGVHANEKRDSGKISFEAGDIIE